MLPAFLINRKRKIVWHTMLEEVQYKIKDSIRQSMKHKFGVIFNKNISRVLWKQSWCILQISIWDFLENLLELPVEWVRFKGRTLAALAWKLERVISKLEDSFSNWVRKEVLIKVILQATSFICHVNH